MTAAAPAGGRTEPIHGMEMHVELRGEGEPLLLLHGFTGAGADWRLVFPTPPEGFRVVAPDLRGHGRSTNPAGEFTFRQCGLDVRALLDRLGIGRVRAIGLSGGGQALLHLATQEPERVESMVLVSTAPYFPAAARAIMSQLTAESRSAAEWQEMRARHAHGDDQIRALWRHGRELKDSYDDVNFTPPLLSTITARTLIVHGDRDPFYPAAIALEMYAAIPRADLWIVPNAGHAPIFGDDRDPFATGALAFLRRPSA